MAAIPDSLSVEDDKVILENERLHRKEDVRTPTRSDYNLLTGGCGKDEHNVCYKDCKQVICNGTLDNFQGDNSKAVLPQNEKIVVNKGCTEEECKSALSESDGNDGVTKENVDNLINSYIDKELTGKVKDITTNHLSIDELDIDKCKNEKLQESANADKLVNGEVKDILIARESVSSLLKHLDLNSKPEDLTCLTLASLKLENLNHDFSPCINVSDVDVSDNLLSSLPESFCTLKKCLRLNLSNNRLKNVPQCLYLGLHFIRELDLSHNLIEEFNLSPLCIAYLVSLNISHNKLTMPPWWLLHDISSCLVRLDLSFNFCLRSKLPLAFFDDITTHNRICSRILELKLTNTGLCTYNMKFLKQFVCLKKLILSTEDSKNVFYNSIEALPEDSSNQMPLEVLEVENCQLSGLPDHIDKMSHLTVLKISKNNFSWLPEKFVNLECLRILEASHCNLLYLPNEMGLLTSLVELWLSFNDLASLPDVRNCRDLRVLDLYSNSFSEMPDTVLSLPLQGFDISGNCFNPIPSEKFRGGPEYNDLKNALRRKLDPSSPRSDFMKIEKSNHSSYSSGSLSHSFRSSSSKSGCSWQSRSSSLERQFCGFKKKNQEEEWDVDPDETWDPNAYTGMERWTNDDSLSSCRFLASTTHKDSFFCPFKERSNFHRNLYFVFEENELGQFDDA